MLRKDKPTRGIVEIGHGLMGLWDEGTDVTMKAQAGGSVSSDIEGLQNESQLPTHSIVLPKATMDTIFRDNNIGSIGGSLLSNNVIINFYGNNVPAPLIDMLRHRVNVNAAYDWLEREKEPSRSMVQGLVWNRDSHIVLGIHVGATQSAVVFAHLYKGGVANVHRVSDWPGQGNFGRKPWIPTQIYYNRFGEAVKVGAETYFNQRLHPDTMGRTHNLAMEDLPNGITLMKIYVDFFRYHLKHTEEYFGSHVLHGRSEWNRHSPSMDVVIAHPNGWGVKEQDFLCGAAVTAGYATAANAPSQIKLVSEAEASVHRIFHMDIDSKMSPGTVFVVCDAGRARVVTTVYEVDSDVHGLASGQKPSQAKPKELA
ncbi:hypothetical protein PILCRDRAFT_16599 [Piloderma croceum F 1598]|uniref:Uncharacterized protein n=1 Tax=Piloderma croceum (strain F 1598) TaxID=765440 RepID=A0A0C3B3R1_PILCF|nr:hypothetical protein PILCRDRAFT_16599 [Piloderma croceum F 1598]